MINYTKGTLFAAREPQTLDFSTLVEWRQVFEDIEYEYEDDVRITFDDWVSSELVEYQLAVYCPNLGIVGDRYATLEEASVAYHRAVSHGTSASVLVPWNTRTEEILEDYTFEPLAKR